MSSYYSAYYTIAFDSIVYIMVEVGKGWLIRYLHVSGSLFIMLLLMLHWIRGYWLRLKNIDTINYSWYSGWLVMIVVMIEAFLGYILIWGKMSYWGVTVLINIVTGLIAEIMGFIGYLTSANTSSTTFNFDVFSSSLISSVNGFIWCSIYSITIRVFVLHFMLGFIIIGLIFLHLFLLHSFSGSNTLFNSNSIAFPFFPIIVYKDCFVFSLFTIILSSFLFFDFEEIAGNSENVIKASSISTPQHILPEWYFLIYYCCLRCFSSKVIGVFMVLYWFILLI